jgi:hypothetical protein
VSDNSISQNAGVAAEALLAVLLQPQTVLQLQQLFEDLDVFDLP